MKAELSKLLISCFTSLETRVLKYEKYPDRVHERNGKSFFGRLKILVRFLQN